MSEYDIQEALKILQEHIRDPGGDVMRQGVRDNDKTRAAIETLFREGKSFAEMERLLRSSVPERHKGAASPVGAVQNYIAELEAALTHAEGEAIGELTIDKHGDAYFKVSPSWIDLEQGKHKVYTHPAPQVAVPEGWKAKVLELCAAVENDADLPPVKYALKCGRLINEVKDMLATAPTAPAGEQPVSDPDGLPSGWRSELERIRELIAGAPKDALGSGVAPACAPWPIRDEVVHNLTQILTAPAPDEREASQVAPAKEPLHEIADALDCFWNAAIGAAHGNETVGAIAQGLSAVAERLREHELSRLRAGKEGQ